MANSPSQKKPEQVDSPVKAATRPRHSKKSGHGGDGEAAMAHDESNWLVSYADMMTLLFGFFVLMYSFSKIDEKKFEIVRKDVARYFGGQIRINPSVKKLEAEVKELVTQAGLDKKVELVARDSEIELRFQGSLHFVSGTAILTKDSAFVLEKLIDNIKRNIKADSVTVEGHTDDEPIFSTLFPSNWELSSARASTVIRQFERYGFDPSKLTAKGYGSSRPLLPNRDSKGDPIPDNQDVNRRVIVTIAFSREMEDAIHAMKGGEFVSADSPELDPEKAKTPLVRDGEGEPTWREKIDHDVNSTEAKLKLAEARLKETEEKNQAAKRLADMQNKLQEIERKISNSETETEKYVKQTSARKEEIRSLNSPLRKPASPDPTPLPTPANSKSKTARGNARKGKSPVAPVVASDPDPQVPLTAAEAAAQSKPLSSDSAPPDPNNPK